MTIDALSKSSTIEFQKPLTLEETEELLDYVAENLLGDIHTKSDYCTQRHHYTDDKKTDKK